ncbi:ATP-dependent zinc metalloprotease FtsH [Caldalkalibacillus mannanilyticus]|uniref:ATP-dependent zinc metalloprotease FtsH n=1 Tax=Caldalkalibacillus mannanilyticus TaxID=1418 RepID=UPI0004691201|nr:ATP-dependent zinc metalloprotease FtsH [Caldalkalibacillus mannanilyticus]
MNRFLRNTVFYLLIFLVVIGIVQFIVQSGQESPAIEYTEFVTHLERGEIDSVNVQAARGVWFIDGKFVKGAVKDSEGKDRDRFITHAPMNSERTLEIINQSKAKVTFIEAKGDPVWLTFFTTLIPFLLIFILFFFLMSQAQGGGNKVMNFGKSKAKLYSEEKKKVTFKDVAGADEEKQELVEIVEFLKDPRKFTTLGARIPKGVLLVGPPGTGKTLLGRAVAGEAGVPFFSISGSDFVEMFVGVGASRVRDLFENAKKNAPCIIFIDEIDAVGRQRGAGLGGGHDEREQTLNQLLVEMDGFGANEGIIIMAATNRPDVLDPALLRPGRFDRQITVDRPDVRGREAVLQVHSRNKPLSDDVKLDVIARRTPGFSGADLENLLNEAALLAARRNKKDIAMQEIDDAIDRVIAGTEKKSRRVSDKEQRIVAYHEAGHTIVGVYLDGSDTVHKVTIVPRGNAGGYAVMLPKEDRFMMTEQELKDRIVGLLGGRVAEEIILGEVSTGASNDFQRATGIARRMVMEFGMSRLGPLQYGESQGQVFLGRDIGHERNYSEAIAHEIDQEVQRIVKEQYERCRELLTQYRDKLELIAQTLLEVETLTAEQISDLVNNGKISEENMPKKPSEEKKSSVAKEDVKVQIQSKKEDDDKFTPKDDEEKK